MITTGLQIISLNIILLALIHLIHQNLWDSWLYHWEYLPRSFTDLANFPFICLSSWGLDLYILILVNFLQAVSSLNYIHSDKIDFTLPCDHSTHISLVCIYDIKIDIKWFFWILKRKKELNPIQFPWNILSSKLSKN